MSSSSLNDEKEQPKRLKKYILNNVLEKVFVENVPLKTAARNFRINEKELCKYLSLAERSLKNISEKNQVYQRSYLRHKVFSYGQEAVLIEDMRSYAATRFCNSLTSERIRKLAYQFAKSMNICMPNSWRFNKKAGTDWLRGFVKRHPDFHIIKPEVTTDTGIESNEEKSPVQKEDSIVGGKDSPDDIPLFVQGKEPYSFVYNKQREKRV